MKQFLKKLFVEKTKSLKIPPGETELDYLPKEEFEKLRKKSTKIDKVIPQPKVKSK